MASGVLFSRCTGRALMGGGAVRVPAAMFLFPVFIPWQDDVRVFNSQPQQQTERWSMCTWSCFFCFVFFVVHWHVLPAQNHIFAQCEWIKPKTLNYLHISHWFWGLCKSQKHLIFLSFGIFHTIIKLLFKGLNPQMQHKNNTGLLYHVCLALDPI